MPTRSNGPQLAPNALVSLDDVKIFLPDADDDMLVLLINQASAQVETWLGRKLGRADYIEQVKPTGSQEIVLQQWPIVAVEQVLQDGRAIDPDTYDFADTGYYGVLYKDDGWTYDGYTYGLAGDYISAKRNLTAMYTAGYILPPAPDADLPADLQGLVLEMVQSAYGKATSGGNAGLKSFALADVRWEWQTEIPQTWTQVLNQYRRWL